MNSSKAQKKQKIANTNFLKKKEKQQKRKKRYKLSTSSQIRKFNKGGFSIMNYTLLQWTLIQVITIVNSYTSDTFGVFLIRLKLISSWCVPQ